MPTYNSFRTSFIIFTFALIFLNGSLNAQNTDLDTEQHETDTIQTINFRFQHFGEDEGLKQSKILAIQQDQTGYLWLGTDEGLVRYDGYNFETFLHQSDDSTTISNNTILSLFEDSRGWLWIGTEDGLNYFNPYTNSFVRLRTISASYNRRTSNHVLTITEDSSGALWVGNNIGISRIMLPSDVNIHQQKNSPNLNNIPIQHFVPEQDNDLPNEISSLLIDTQGKIWVGSERGLILLRVSDTNKESYSFEYI